MTKHKKGCVLTLARIARPVPALVNQLVMQCTAAAFSAVPADCPCDRRPNTAGGADFVPPAPVR